MLASYHSVAPAQPPQCLDPHDAHRPCCRPGAGVGHRNALVIGHAGADHLGSLNTRVNHRRKVKACHNVGVVVLTSTRAGPQSCFKRELVVKIHLALFFLLSFGANAQVIIYRCGNEYRNDLTVEEAKTCKRISPANPDPLKWELTSLSEASKFYLEKKAAIRDEQFLKKWALIVYSQAQRTLRNEEYR